MPAPARPAVQKSSSRTGKRRQPPGTPSTIVDAANRVRGRADAAAEEIAAALESASAAPADPKAKKQLSPEVAAVWPALEKAINKALSAFGPLSADNAHLYRELAVLQGRPWHKHYLARKEFGA